MRYWNTHLSRCTCRVKAFGINFKWIKQLEETPSGEKLDVEHVVKCCTHGPGLWPTQPAEPCPLGWLRVGLRFGCVLFSWIARSYFMNEVNPLAFLFREKWNMPIYSIKENIMKSNIKRGEDHWGSMAKVQNKGLQAIQVAKTKSVTKVRWGSCCKWNWYAPIPIIKCITRNTILTMIPIVGRYGDPHWWPQVRFRSITSSTQDKY